MAHRTSTGTQQARMGQTVSHVGNTPKAEATHTPARKAVAKASFRMNVAVTDVEVMESESSLDDFWGADDCCCTRGPRGGRVRRVTRGARCARCAGAASNCGMSGASLPAGKADAKKRRLDSAEAALVLKLRAAATGAALGGGTTAPGVARMAPLTVSEFCRGGTTGSAVCMDAMSRGTHDEELMW